MPGATWRWDEFRRRVRAAVDQGGVTEDELKEALVQTAVHAGAPAANTGFTVAAEVLRELAAKPD